MTSPVPPSAWVFVVALAALNTAHPAHGNAPALATTTPTAPTTLTLSQPVRETSPESTPDRSKLPMQAAVPSVQSSTLENTSALESGLVLALTGVAAILVVARRRLPR